ncbi:MAG: hypothetical protein AB7L90_03415 [Hyphomicrobiaceae bacterium]
MKTKTLALGFALGLAAIAPAQAQRGGGGNWELLAEERVSLGSERDVIRLNHDESYFRTRAYRKLRFVASGGEVRMKTVRLVYLNGHAETIDFSQTLRPGQDVDLDLRGERSYLRHIEMNYRSKLGISIGGGGIKLNQPSIRVFGENVRFAPPPPPPGPPPARGFDEIARERFDRRDNRVVVRVGRREGRFGRIKLRNTSNDTFEIIGVVAEFGNGERQPVRVRQNLRPGEETATIDLAGEQRFLRSVTIDLDPRRRPGGVEIMLLGSERPGGRPGLPPGPPPRR